MLGRTAGLPPTHNCRRTRFPLPGRILLAPSEHLLRADGAFVVTRRQSRLGLIGPAHSGTAGGAARSHPSEQMDEAERDEEKAEAR